MLKTDEQADLMRRRRRIAAMRAVRKAGASALLVSAPEDVRYLSGFSGEDSFILLGGAWACLITDGRFVEQAGRECPGVEVRVRDGPIFAAVGHVIRKRRVRRLGFQPEHLTVQWRNALADACRSAGLVPVGLAVAKLRQRKDAGEVRAILKAVRVAERAFRKLVAGGMRAFVGRTERQVAAELDFLMRLAGADGPAFETIVAAGANASLPHHRPGGRRIRRGDAVLMDWGAKAGGYCSDLTRVVFVGKIRSKAAEIYRLVRRAQAVGLAAVRPGASCRAVDASARGVIEAAGYGREFLHGLGHGIGLAIHESPGLGRVSRGRLREGMVVTVEPGIYLPGVGGVRIEDDVLVTASGWRKLTTLPTSPEAMTLR